jgi:hypothetical protein
VAIKARSSGHPFASKKNDNEELLQSYAFGYGLILCSTEYGNGLRDNDMLMHGREPDESAGPQICRFRNSEKSSSAGFMDQESSNRATLILAIGVSNTDVRSFAER